MFVKVNRSRFTSIQNYW